MDGEAVRMAAILGSIVGGFGTYGFIIKQIYRRQNKDHDCVIGLKKDTEYIRERMDALVDAFNEMNGKTII